MRNFALLFTAVVSVVSAGCGDNDDDLDDIVDDDGDGQPDDTTQPPTPPTPPTPTPRMWRADIRGNDIYSTLTGSSLVTAFEDDQGFTATVTLQGDEPGSVRPWHVHVGICESGGAIVGPDEAYPRLRIGADGSADASTNVLVALDDGSYHVNIHHSDEFFSDLIACGNLIRQ
jgi:hypothetical protein